MLRVNREKLDAAIVAVTACAESATDVQGLRVIFSPSQQTIEHMICGALSIIAPSGGPVTPEDVIYISGVGTPDRLAFPPEKVKAA